MDMQKIRVFVGDDENLFREILVRALVREESIEIIGQAATGKEILEQVGVLQPHVVLLDINLPDCSGLEVLETLKSRHPDVMVIILTGLPQDKYIFMALQRGASGFLSKSTSIERLREALRVAREGKVFLDPDATTKLAREYLRIEPDAMWTSKNLPDPDRKSRLTSREAEILQFLGKGMSNREIAATIQLSENTIKRHLTSLFRKIKVKDRIQAIFYAMEKGLR